MQDSSYPTPETVQAHYTYLARDYDRQANRACKRAYRRLVQTRLNGAQRVLEVGAGATDLLAASQAPFRVACDLSVPMLQARGAASETGRVAADAERLPFPKASFDAVLSINVVEHVPDPGGLFAETARVLTPEGRCLVVTPNGHLERLLDLLEVLHLKLPEGPHRFLTTEALAQAVAPAFDVVEHRPFLSFPLGPERFVWSVDRVFGGWGLFQYALLRKRGR